MTRSTCRRWHRGRVLICATPPFAASSKANQSEQEEDKKTHDFFNFGKSMGMPKLNKTMLIRLCYIWCFDVFWTKPQSSHIFPSPLPPLHAVAGQCNRFLRPAWKRPSKTKAMETPQDGCDESTLPFWRVPITCKIVADQFCSFFVFQTPLEWRIPLFSNKNWAQHWMLLSFSKDPEVEDALYRWKRIWS